MNQQLQFTTTQQKRNSLMELLTELACNPEDISIPGTADVIEILYGLRCPKCSGTEIRNYVGTAGPRRCLECGMEVLR